MHKLIILMLFLFIIVSLQAEANCFMPKAEAIMKDGSHITGYFEIFIEDFTGADKNMIYQYRESCIPVGADLMKFVHPISGIGGDTRYVPDYFTTPYGNLTIAEHIRTIDLNKVSKLVMLTPPRKSSSGYSTQGVYATEGWTVVSQSNYEKLQKDTGMYVRDYYQIVVCANPTLDKSEFYLDASLILYEKGLEVSASYEDENTVLPFSSPITGDKIDTLLEMCDKLTPTNMKQLKQAVLDTKNELNDWLLLISKTNLVKEQAKPDFVNQIIAAVSNCDLMNIYLDKSLNIGKLSTASAPDKLKKLIRVNQTDILSSVLQPSFVFTDSILSDDFDELLPKKDIVIIELPLAGGEM
jgi:hypothetical protein